MVRIIVIRYVVNLFVIDRDNDEPNVIVVFLNIVDNGVENKDIFLIEVIYDKKDLKIDEIDQNDVVND